MFRISGLSYLPRGRMYIYFKENSVATPREELNVRWRGQKNCITMYLRTQCDTKFSRKFSGETIVLHLYSQGPKGRHLGARNTTYHHRMRMRSGVQRPTSTYQNSCSIRRLYTRNVPEYSPRSHAGLECTRFAK